MPVFNTGFAPGFNAILPNVINKVGKTIVSSNVYTSPFSSLVQGFEVGEYLENLHVNIGTRLLQDTVNNSNMLQDYHPDIASAYSKVNLDLSFPVSLTGYRIRESASVLENFAEIVSVIKANLAPTFEYSRNNEVKQMLYNAYDYGMLSSVTIADPRTSPDNAGAFAVALNTAIDDFRNEISPRDLAYNLQNGIMPDQYHKVVANNMPMVITFSEYIRFTEFWNAVNLGWVGQFASNNKNDEWERRIIQLNIDDWPTGIPPKPRSGVTGQNVVAPWEGTEQINFFEMPKNMRDGTDLYPGTPTGGNTILAIVLDPEAIILQSQLEVSTNFINPATLSDTTRIIYRGIEDINAFKKIRVITAEVAP